MDIGPESRPIRPLLSQTRGWGQNPRCAKRYSARTFAGYGRTAETTPIAPAPSSGGLLEKHDWPSAVQIGKAEGAYVSKWAECGCVWFLAPCLTALYAVR